MAEEYKIEALIGIGNDVDLALDNRKQIVALRRGPGGIEMSMILCKANDHDVESLKGYIDRLLTLA